MTTRRRWKKRIVGPWMGRMWTVYRVTDANDCEHLDQSMRGSCSTDAGKITVRAQDRDGELLVIIHEMIHTGQTRLYDTAARPEVDNLAVAIKSGLEAFGVDLSPMLRGYK